MRGRSTSGPIGLFFACTSRIFSRPRHIGRVDHDLAVEAARAKERRIQNVNAVGCGDEHHGIVFLEAVHLDEQLVQRLLALIVATAQTSAALAADGIDLVDEDD